MRFKIVAVVLLVLPALAPTGADTPKEGVKVPAGPAAPEKPEVRHIQLKSGDLAFEVLLRPGAADPQQVVEVNIELSEVPPVPDPIYGERIPVKAAEMLAEVVDADGAGYAVKYQVHQLQDAGSYGFHFTPVRKDNYRVSLKGTLRQRKYAPSFRVPVGIWPFTEVDEKGSVSAVPAQAAASRLPAVPVGMSGPAIPGGVPQKAEPGRRQTPLGAAMKRLGDA